MMLTTNVQTQAYNIDISTRISIAIEQTFSQESQPNHFGATPAISTPMAAGGFIGDTLQGGSCNVSQLTINPHCNGTHTETIAHICHANDPRVKKINELSLPLLMPAILISVTPIKASGTSDSYRPNFTSEDVIISADMLREQLEQYPEIKYQVLVIRTLPNGSNKQRASYNQEHAPAFFSREAISYINSLGVQHIIVDLPSLDRLHDEGYMTCHHLFWQVPEQSHNTSCESQINKTVTELAYIDNTVVDGTYFANIQLPSLNSDAAPSWPVLYPAQPAVILNGADDE